MKNWNFSMRDGSNSINFDFDTNDPAVLQEKLQAFISVCYDEVEDEEDTQIPS